MAYLRAQEDQRPRATTTTTSPCWRDDGQHVTDSGSVSNRLDVVECDVRACSAREVPDPDQARAAARAGSSRSTCGWRHEGSSRRSPTASRQALLARVATLIRTYLSPEVMQRADARPPSRLRARRSRAARRDGAGGRARAARYAVRDHGGGRPGVRPPAVLPRSGGRRCRTSSTTSPIASRRTTR